MVPGLWGIAKRAAGPDQQIKLVMDWFGMNHSYKGRILIKMKLLNEV